MVLRKGDLVSYTSLRREYIKCVVLYSNKKYFSLFLINCLTILTLKSNLIPTFKFRNLRKHKQ